MKKEFLYDDAIVMHNYEDELWNALSTGQGKSTFIPWEMTLLFLAKIS